MLFSTQSIRWTVIIFIYNYLLGCICCLFIAILRQLYGIINRKMRFSQNADRGQPANPNKYACRNFWCHHLKKAIFWGRKVDNRVGSLMNPVDIVTFDLQGQMSRSKVKWCKYYIFFQLYSVLQVLSYG